MYTAALGDGGPSEGRCRATISIARSVSDATASKNRDASNASGFETAIRGIRDTGPLFREPNITPNGEPERAKENS